MFSFITLIHVVVAIILMISVLLQTGKGSGLGAAFGGSSSSVFGARGPGTFIGRVTTVAAIVFMVTSLTLSVFAEGAYKRGSVIEADPEPVPVAAPVEGRSVSEEEAQIPVDPSLLPAPSLEVSPTEAISETSPETTAPEAAAPAAGNDDSTSDSAAKDPGVSAPAEGGATTSSEPAAEQSSTDQSATEQNAAEQNSTKDLVSGESQPTETKPSE
ncbi:MAG: preprotein translocase subunit SecG [Deltaproteobacteria bacterium]|jgi:preprotein translocase subunit SecG|nr:preprotein translocase subunit SecG [Deltaproteobacteria bacterium]